MQKCTSIAFETLLETTVTFKNAHVLKNRSNLAAKKLKQSEIRCLTNPLIDECACENLRDEFVAARSELQFVSKKAYHAYYENVEKSIKSDPKAFFKFVDLKKKRVGLPSVMKDEVATTIEAKNFLPNSCRVRTLMTNGCHLILDQMYFQTRFRLDLSNSQ
jgi:hypothetical protein